MANELISVLLPNYNGSAHLKETIESVLCQTYENLELIVIDDGSTDSSPQIIRSMREKDGSLRQKPAYLLCAEPRIKGGQRQVHRSD